MSQQVRGWNPAAGEGAPAHADESERAPESVARDRVAAALMLGQQLLRQQSHHVAALVRLGETLHGTAHQQVSIDLLERALALQPGHPGALVMSAAGRMLSARFDDEALIRQRLEALLALAAKPRDIARAAYWAPFLDLPLAYERRCWRKMRDCIERTMASSVPFMHPGRRDHARLRLGYIGPHFGDHPVGQVTHQLYGAHDRDRFEVFVYPTDERRQDRSVFKQTIAETADHYRPLQGLAPSELARIIHADAIDILIDLNGYMGSTRIIETFALRPAPLQLYWLGHGGSMGLPYYDYIIGDRVVTPAADDGNYDDAVLRLPHCLQPASAYPIAAATPSRASQGLADGVRVFCAFNNPIKINREVFDAWMRILSAVPGSQLWLTDGDNPQVAVNLRRCAQALGVDAHRLVFARRLPDKGEHFARHRLADLFLDTFTMTASTTCQDALWGGLPVITRPGRHFCSRIAASMVHTAGLDELICDSTQGYVDLAIALARDPVRLAALRERTRAACITSPLFDIKRFARGLDAALLRIWEWHQQGQRPVGMTVPPP